MNIEQRKEFLRLTLKSLAQKWFPDVCPTQIEVWVAVMYGNKLIDIRNGADFVEYSSDKFPQHPIPYACEEAGIDSRPIPVNQKIICSFADEISVIKPIDRTREMEILCKYTSLVA